MLALNARRLDRRRLELLPAARQRVVRALQLIEAKQAGRARHAGRRSSTTRPYDELRRLGAAADSRSSAARKVPPADRHAGRRRKCSRASNADGPLAVGDVLVVDQRQADVRLRARSTRCSTTASARQSKPSSARAAAARAASRSRCRTCTRSRRPTTSRSATACCTRCPGSMARHMNVPISGVYVANPGYMLGVAGIPRGARADRTRRQAAQEPRRCARRIFQTLGHGQRATVRFFTMEDTRTPQLTSIRIDRRLVPGPRIACATMRSASGPARRSPRAGRAAAEARRRRTSRAPATSWWTNTRRRSCSSSSTCRTPMSGVTERNYHGTGVVARRRCAASSPWTATRCRSPLGDVRLTFAGTVAGAGNGRVRASAAQPRRRLATTRSSARRHAGQGREVR